MCRVGIGNTSHEVQCFWVPWIATVFFWMIFIITIAYPLHVSTPTDHLQVQYIYWLFHKELFSYNGTLRWPVGVETCSGYVIAIIKIIPKNTVVIDGTRKHCSNRSNRMQPSKIKIHMRRRYWKYLRYWFVLLFRVTISGRKIWQASRRAHLTIRNRRQVWSRYWGRL
jgi:hypothetical protein